MEYIFTKTVLGFLFKKRASYLKFTVPIKQKSHYHETFTEFRMKPSLNLARNVLVENNQSNIWAPLAKKIREEVSPKSRIVTVTGLDPTLLNLSRRQGWLSSADNVDQSTVKDWISDGAKYIAGSLNWQESYIPLDNHEAKKLMKKFPCEVQKAFCPNPPNNTYLIPLNALLR